MMHVIASVHLLHRKTDWPEKKDQKLMEQSFMLATDWSGNTKVNRTVFKYDYVLAASWQLIRLYFNKAGHLMLPETFIVQSTGKQFSLALYSHVAMLHSETFVLRASLSLEGLSFRSK